MAYKTIVGDVIIDHKYTQNEFALVPLTDQHTDYPKPKNDTKQCLRLPKFMRVDEYRQQKYIIQ